MMTHNHPRRTLVRWLTIVTICGALPAVVLAQTADKQPSSRVAVASHEIARGVMLLHTDIGYVAGSRIADRNPTAAAAPAIEPAAESDSLVGWMTRRLITAGEPLRAPAVVPPQFVKSGELVDVVFQSDGVSVTMRGKATRSAAIGERVVVRMDNQRRLEGTVIAPGRVRVN